MLARLQARGLAIALSTLALLLLSPTPIHHAIVHGWETVQGAAASGDLAAAVEALHTIQLEYPWLAEARQAEIPLALAGGDGARALSLLESGAASQSDPAVAACWRAEALVLVDRWDEAAAVLSADGAPGCPRALDRLQAQAQAALAMQRAPQAIVLLDLLTALDHSDAASLALLGAARLATDPATAPPLLESAAAAGDPLAADLLTALSSAPAGDEMAQLAQAGRVFLQRQAWPLAALAFERLSQHDPTNGEALAYLGLSLMQLGQDGLGALEQAVRLAPDSATAHSLLGLYWQAEGQPGKALPFLQRALELDPSSSAFTASLAAAQAESGDVQSALGTFRQAAELDPDAPAFWGLLADFSLGREIEIAGAGLPAARNALVLAPGEAASIDRLGYGHFLLGRHVVAERLLCRALELDPTSASARLHYGLLLVALGRGSEAEAQLTAAGALAGDTPLGELARRALAQLEP